MIKHYLPRRSIRGPEVPSPPTCTAQTAGGVYTELQPALNRRFPRWRLFPANAAWLQPTENVSAPFAWYRLELPEGQVWGTQGWIANRQGELVRDVFSEPAPNWLAEASATLEAVKKQPARRLAGLTATLAMPNHTNYFHWVWQGLPRVEFYRPIFDQVDHWIIPPHDRSYLKESLEKFGIDWRKVVHGGPGIIHCERLCVAAQPHSSSYADAANFPGRTLRSLFALPRPRPANRVFVVRGAVTARQLVNETAVAERLARHGFTVATMDGLSMAEQGDVFSGAEAIVAVHGAALANLVFCPPGTKVIELLPRNWPVPIYARLAHDLKLDYYCLAGCEPALRFAPIQNLSADLVVDLQQLDGVLRHAGLA